VRRWGRYILYLGAAGLAVLLGLLIYINTNSFQALVRRRLVAEVERITGGRAEISSIHTIPFRLQAEARGITVHGRESAGDVPLAHADGVVARLKITSILRSEFGFHELILEKPTVHVQFYPDGSTNFPPRPRSASTGETAVEKLFALSIDHFEIRHGKIQWEDQTIPLDFAARDTSLQMDYYFLQRRYEGRLLVGLVDTKLMDCRPFAWMASMGFSLTANSAVVTAFHWNSGHSHLSAQAQVTDFRHPKLQANYDGQFDLTEAASIARRNDLRAGTISLKGHGDWSFDQFAANGFVGVENLAFQNDQVAVSRASANSNYSVSDQQIKFSKMQGKIFGGSFTGDAEFNEWLAPQQHLSAAARKNLETAVISSAPPLKKPTEKPLKVKPPAIQTASVVLRLRDLSSQDLTAAIRSAAHPASRFHPAALASGTLDATWKGTSRDAEIRFSLDLVPPDHHAPPELPLTAHANGVYYFADDTLDLPQFSAVTPTSRVRAAGTLSSTSAIRLSVTTSSLADWLPFIEVVRGPALFPVVLNGSATFNGNMTGSISSPELSGVLLVQDFDVNLPASAKTQPLHTHWDSFSTALQLSFQAAALHNANLRRDGTTAEFDFTSALQAGHFTAESAFNLNANIHNGDLGEVQSLLGYDYPFTGKADVSLQLSGTASDPRGDGEIHLTSGSIYGEQVQRFDSEFHIANGELAFDQLHLFHDDAVATGSAAYNPSTRAFRLDVVGKNFDLAQFQQFLSSRFVIEGHADFNLKASGTREAPSINAGVHLRDLAVDNELAGDLDVQAATQGSELRLTGNSHLRQGSLILSGNVQLRDGYPAQLSFQMDRLDLDALWRAYLPGKLTGHSAVAGNLEMHGPLRDPAQWIVAGSLSSLAVDVENVKAHSQDQVRFTVAAESLKVLQLHLLGDGTDLTARGSVQLVEPYALDFITDGHLDLKLLSDFNSDFTSSGVVTMNMTVAGTFDDPLPQGTLQVSGGAISYVGLPSGLTGLDGSLSFTRDHLRVDALTARTGGGTLDLKGDASYVNHQLNFDLAARGKDVRLRYPPGVSSTADADLRWVGSRSNSTVSGDITINKMAVTPGFDFSAYLERSRQFSAVAASNSPLNNVHLDLHVQTAPELQMRTAVARLSGDADLHLRGSVARPAVLGRVDILEGQATFHGTKFTLERGDITFANPVAIEPQLNLQASTHVRNYDLNITVTGTSDRLSLNYRSEPPLPKSDIIALLALGRTNEESAQLQEQSGQSAFSDQATALILSQALNTTVSSRLDRLFGASNIKIDPQGLTTETNPISNGPQITIEQEFANHISLTYSTNVSQSSQQIIQGEYYVNRSVSVVGNRDQNGVVSFDVRVRNRKK
jgi:translocation and assembly module TamB